jgi:predicted O-methyltransferase YrrM
VIRAAASTQTLGRLRFSATVNCVKRADSLFLSTLQRPGHDALGELSSAMVTHIKELVPRSLKESIKALDRERKMRRAVRKINRLKEGEILSQELLAMCQEGWGDDGFRAVGGYLEEVVQRAATSEGPILEIGSGLTTLLLGLLAGRRGVQVWTLEHLPEFHRHIQTKLKRYHISNVHPILAPLSDYGEFAWYGSPELESMPLNFSLIIADGPPENTKGGRYGLLPVMRAHLAPGAVILLDDAERASEQTVLNQWQAQYDFSYDLRWQAGKAWAVSKLS